MNVESIITAGLIVSFLNSTLIIMSTLIHRNDWKKHRNINIAAITLFLSIGLFYYEYKSLASGNNPIVLTFLTFLLFSFSVSMFVRSIASLYSIKPLFSMKYSILISICFAALVTLVSYYGLYSIKFALYNACVMIPMASVFGFLRKCKIKLHTSVFFYLIIFIYLILLHNIGYVSLNLIDADYTNIPKRVFTWVVVSLISIEMIYVAYIIEQNVIDLNKTRGNFDLLQELHDKVRKISETDHLTNLYNRRKISDILNHLTSINNEFSILICDVNKFKSINDQFGHLVGDEALIFIAQKLESIVRSNDIVGRWGGDEFIVILPNTNKEYSEIVKNKIIDYFRSEIFNKINQTISISCGYSTYNNTMSLHDLINDADIEMYNDKKNI